MLNPDVSIIVAVYNAENCLRRCLDSLVNQSHKNIEIICVNDASTDSSQLIIEEYSVRDPRVKSIVHNKNTNAGGAMNDGIKAAAAPYVCIVDNDDWIELNAIRTMLEETEDFNVGIVTPRWYKYVTEASKEERKNLIDAEKEDVIRFSFSHGWRLLGNLIKKEIFTANELFFPENVFFEDNAISYCILFYARKIKVINTPLYYYACAQDSVCSTVSLQKIKDRICTTDLFIQNLRDRGFLNSPFDKLASIKYVEFSNNTIKMLAHVPYKESRTLYYKIRRGIRINTKRLSYLDIILNLRIMAFSMVHYYSHVFKNKLNSL